MTRTKERQEVAPRVGHDQTIFVPGRRASRFSAAFRRKSRMIGWQIPSLHQTRTDLAGDCRTDPDLSPEDRAAQAKRRHDQAAG